MSHSGDDSLSDAAEECYNAEFRSYPDDDWYNVRVLFAGNSGDKMRVKFHKASAQLQDPDCSMVVKGMRVCSSDSFGNDDVRFYDAIIDERKCAPRSLSAVGPLGGIEFGCASKQEETDLGGDKNLHKILVQNLEKELSSSTVSEFIHKQTSITTRVYIFPSLPWEPYTNGVIMMNCQKDLERLLGFLQNPNHFIASLNGRPWVATEKLLTNDHWTLMLSSPNKLLNRKVAGLNNELKVVCYGTKEYNKAKELRDLFLQFIEHQRGLYKKLRMEERNIS